MAVEIPRVPSGRRLPAQRDTGRREGVQLAAMARGLIEQAREHGLTPAEIVDLVTGEL